MKTAKPPKNTRNRKPIADFDGKGVLADGTRVPLYANVGEWQSAAEKAASLNAEGVGLLRTEFGFLGHDAEPSIETQAATYKSVFDAFPGKHIVVRTLDAGADKPLPFLNVNPEENPALGVRGFRTDWTVPGVLTRQLEAIKQASEDSDADIWGDGADDFDHLRGSQFRENAQGSRPAGTRRDG